ncbi:MULTISPECIES: tryptophan--tRNA ligase [Deefgea]|uniref:Tryptophan--tRNA ligase n=1 Tax=Deefgea chitinilytica TaxID=570276 RepID=A0ABS2CAU2_9NEIS|nr:MULTISPECIES: tryptophan--tRNA ligase [Deefgea]MBM5571260.1 tryptophan--tRNA ligase [Deefgea chitinilytica]MBM9888492.1 tryptophan--tRNA ligase [Deefgea sp. CFH1-16]
MSISTSPSIIVTGDRTTGPLHLGHFAGSLQTRLTLQESHNPFILLADTQALADHQGDYRAVRQAVLDVALDYLAVGINPQKSTILIQSMVPELAELSFYLLNLVSLARLERNPTVKSELRAKGYEGQDRNIAAGFLSYPVSQAADITALRGTLIPVGEDQLPMIEQTNEIVRRFNRMVGENILNECEALLSNTTRLPGIDGKGKMSRTAGNHIALSASSDEISAAVNRMYTDAQHLSVTSPGQIEGNVVFAFLDAFDSDIEHVNELKAQYQHGGLADSVIKARLNDVLQALIAPIRTRRAEYAQDPDAVLSMLLCGSAKARQTAALTLHKVKTAMGMYYF